MIGVFGVFSRADNISYIQSNYELAQSLLGISVDSLNTINLGKIYIGIKDNINSVPLYIRERNFYFCAYGRIDNRTEIARTLNLTQTELLKLSDSQLMLALYLELGDNSPMHIYGDWVFVAWHPQDNRLFIARDHFGSTSLYYYLDHNIFAFASSRQLLLSLKLSPHELNELYLAQVLISWPAYHGENTIDSSLKRLPPAHTLSVTDNKITISQYWYLENTPVLNLRNREEYIDAFQETFKEAVSSRLRTLPINDPNKQVSVALSGGLDSGAVTAIAANLLQSEGKKLFAYTAVPCRNTKSFIGHDSDYELQLATATVNHVGNINHCVFDSKDITPVAAIRQMIDVFNEPVHSAGNLYWILKLNKLLAESGGTVLLTGQMGNGSISWSGKVSSQSLSYQLKTLGITRWLKLAIKRNTPNYLLTSYYKNKQNIEDWCKSSAINPAFAKRINLMDQYYGDHDSLAIYTPLNRLHLLKPGKNNIGCMHAEIGAAFGTDLRDPTADARVLALTYSIPDKIFIDPVSNTRRWLIRESMKGYLPEKVRQNKIFGHQASDIVYKLRESYDEVTSAISELEKGPAAIYIDVNYLKNVLQMIHINNTYEAFSKSMTVLCRGIMAGLYVNKYYK